MKKADIVWKSSGCAIQGRSHIDKGIPCQDKIGMRSSNGTYVICLSDGAGSARLSHFGAECVVEYGINLFASSFDDVFRMDDGDKAKTVILEAIIDGIKEKSKELSCDLKDLAATLLVVAVQEDKYIIVHIGDGVIGYFENGEIKVASAPSNGEFSNETFFVTSSDAASYMKVFKGSIKNIEGFVIMSDGTEQSLYNKNNKSLGKAVIKLLKHNVMLNETAMEEQLQQTFQNLIVPKTHDDCSIVLLSRGSKHIHSIEEMTYQEKCEVYKINLNDKCVKRRVRRYDALVMTIDKPERFESISQKIHLKPKYTRKQLNYLCELGLFKCKNGLYCSNICNKSGICPTEIL